VHAFGSELDAKRRRLVLREEEADPDFLSGETRAKSQPGKGQEQNQKS